MELKPGYKRTEVGAIPEDWHVKHLGTLMERGRLGGNYPSTDRESSYPLIKMGNLARGYIDIGKVEYIDRGVTPGPIDRLFYGDVLFNTRNTLDLVGKVAIWRNELPVAYYNSNLMRLEFKESEISSNAYANYAFNSKRSVSALRALATGTTSVAAIYTRDLLQLRFIVPPKDEQIAISIALSDVDALISSLDQLIAKKRDIKQATMQQLLTGQQRLPGFGELKSEYRQTEVGVIPGDWNISKVEELGEVVTGGTPSTTRREYWNGSYPWITPTDISTERDMYTSDRLLTRDGLEAIRILPPGSVLVTCIASVGKVAILKTEGSCNQQINAIIPNANHDSTFLYYLFSTAKQYLLANAGITATPIVSKKTFENLSVVNPELHEQKAIAAVLSDMDADITALEQKREKTRALKQGMMQELLTGRIRLV
ncbi:restriction endonuclease subunit S [Burkholderia sp. BCC1640]|uniref:restriction endonuclease subunit S n=1 Tax=Burkholderia sp. BCC1640 TaxID=2676294 RepID=UPI00158A9825|nr:restriction endonuclease subunit S [Burkholderia sp. BCC1640]